MAEDPLTHLKKIVDLLDSGLWLRVDRGAFARYFGHDLDGPNASEAIHAAEAFAQNAGCSFILDADKMAGRFGRAYFKK